MEDREDRDDDTGDVLMYRSPSINETFRANVLYHAAGIHRAELIIEQDCIKSFTFHQFGSEQKDGVSLTRSLSFAKSWKQNGVVFVIDKDKLQQRKRLIQVDFYGSREEAEEFVVGDIRPLSRYLDSILITSTGYDWCKNQNKYSDFKPYVRLMEHPLLKIIP